jgi:hypothetical protein
MQLENASYSALKELYGGSLQSTIEGFIAIDGDKVHGVCGIYMENGRLIMFARLSDELRSYPIFIYKAGIKLLRTAKKRGIPIYALADGDISASVRFLERLGFENYDGVYICHS